MPGPWPPGDRAKARRARSPAVARHERVVPGEGLNRSGQIGKGPDVAGALEEIPAHDQREVVRRSVLVGTSPRDESVNAFDDRLE